MSVTHLTEERCVMCGEIIEEDRQICIRCDKFVYRANGIAAYDPGIGYGIVSLHVNGATLGEGALHCTI